MAIAAVGSKFQRWINAAWQDVADINSILGPNMSKDVVDITSVYSPGGYREFISGLKNSGSVSLSMNFSLANYTAMKADYESELLNSYRIVLPDTANTTVEFTAIVVDLPLSIPVDDKITINVSFQCSGQVIVNGEEYSFIPESSDPISISYDPVPSADPSVDPSVYTGTKLSAPLPAAPTVYNQNCLKCTASGIDYRASAIEVSYKKTADVDWAVWTNSMKSTESATLLYGLDYGSTYQVRWRALGDGVNFTNSDYSSVVSAQTSGLNGAVVYIDPSFAGGGSGALGSITNPRTDFPTIEANTSYLLKRGTTLTRTTQLTVNTRGFHIGAYGTGARPIISNTTVATRMFDFNINTGSGNINITDLDLRLSRTLGTDWDKALLYTYGTGAMTVNIINCSLDGGFQGIRADYAQGTTYRIIGCTIKYQWSDNAVIWGRNLAVASNVEVAYCTLSEANQCGNAWPDDGDNLHCMDISNIHVHHNVMDRSNNDNKFCYIHTRTATMVISAIVEYNTFARQRAGNMSLTYIMGDAGSTNIIRYNTFKDGLLAIQDESVGLQVYGNIFFNLDYVQVANDGSTCVYYNNTFYNIGCFDYVNPGNGVGYGYSVQTLRNNIFHTFNNATYPMFATSINGGTRNSDYNCYYNIRSRNTTLGVHDIQSNPLLVSPGGGNFNLQSASPCIGVGLYIAGFTPPSPVDIGAIQTISAAMSVDSSYDPIVESSDTVLTRLKTPTAGSATIYGQTCIRVGFTNQDYSASAYQLEYKKQTDSVWAIWSSSIKRTENFCEVFGLDANTLYNFRWQALGDGVSFANSYLSATISGTTEAYPNPVYIDPTYTGANGTSNGSITRPYTDIPTISTDLTQEFSYLLKRGTSLSRGQLQTSRTGLHFGAYGTGARPQWHFNGTNAKLLWFAITETAGNININDIDFFSSYTGVSHAVLQFGTCGAITARIINCYVEGGDQGIRMYRSPGTTFRIIGSDVTKSWSDGIFVIDDVAADAGDLLEVGYCNIYDVNLCNPNYPDDGDCIHTVDIRVVHCHHTNMNHSSKPGKFCYINALVNSTVHLHTMEYCTLQRVGPNDAQTLMYTMSLSSTGSLNNIRYNEFFNAGVGLQHSGQLVNVYGNLFYNIGNALDNESSTSAIENYYNNTFYSCDKIIVDNGADIAFRNNIFHTVPGNPAIVSPVSGASRSSDYNCWYNVPNRNLALGTHDITSNPLFVNAANQDFSLQAASPCIGAGLFIANYTRPVPVDMGAIPYVLAVAESSAPYYSEDPQLPPSSEDIPIPTDKLARPSGTTVSAYSPTCLRLGIPTVDDRAQGLKLEYKRASASAWNVWSDTMFGIERYAHVYGLEANTAYNFRWTALGKGLYQDSDPSDISGPSTPAWPSTRTDGLPHHIDVTYAGANGASDGSESRPWSSLPALTTGNTYLFKRGTTYNRSTSILYGATGVHFGAYGSGARPVINVLNGNQLFKFEPSVVGTDNTISIQDLDLINASQNSGYFVYIKNGDIPNYYITVVNCLMKGGEKSVSCDMGCYGTNLRIIGCESSYCWSDNIFLNVGNGYTGADRRVNVEIGYCFIHHSNEEARVTGLPRDQTDGDNVHLYGATTIHVHHSDLDHSTANNKFCFITTGYSTMSCIVEYSNINRTVDGSNDSCMYFDGTAAGTFTIRHNVIRDAGMGMQIPTNGPVLLRVYGNTFFNLDVVCSNASGHDVLFYNNTVYNCRVLFPNYGSTITIRNSIFHTNTGTSAAYSGTATGRDSNYNCYYNIANRNITLGANDITVDPLLVSLSTRNFSLQPGSPCKNTGVVISGYTRAANVDRGSGISVWTDYPDSNNEGR